MRWWALAFFLVSGGLRVIAAPPVNDAFDNAIPLPQSAVDAADNPAVDDQGANYPIGDLSKATAQPGEPLVDGIAGEHSVWFVWTAPVTCHCVFTMQANILVGREHSEAPLLAVYTGDRLDRLNLESRPLPPKGIYGFNTNRVRMGEFQARQGAVYRLRVDATGTNATNLFCGVGLHMAATNDAFASRRVLSVVSGLYIPYSTAAASLDPGEPELGGRTSLWFEVSVPEAGAYLLYPEYTTFQEAMLFQGDRLDSLRPVGWRVADVDSMRKRTNYFTRWYGNPGERYIVRVASDWVGGSWGYFSVVRTPLYDPVPAISVKLGLQLVGPPRLPAPTLRPALFVEGRTNRLYDIQTSSDLREWRHWQWHLSSETNSAVDLENGTLLDPFLRVVAPD